MPQMQASDDFQAGVEITLLRFRVRLRQVLAFAVGDERVLSVVPGRFGRQNPAFRAQILHKSLDLVVLTAVLPALCSHGCALYLAS